MDVRKDETPQNEIFLSPQSDLFTEKVHPGNLF